MILVDVNLLVYAHVDGAPRHDAARAWLDAQLNGGGRVGLPWPSLLGFLRLATNPRITSPPAPLSAAIAQIEAWLGCDNVWIPQPSEGHAEILMQLLRAVGARGNLVSDAHLAALALEHGLTLCSADSDFARFPNLRWIDPLA